MNRNNCNILSQATESDSKENLDPLCSIDKINGIEHYGSGDIWIPCNLEQYIAGLPVKQRAAERKRCERNQRRLQQWLLERRRNDKSGVDAVLEFKQSTFAEEQIWNEFTIARDDFNDLAKLLMKRTCRRVRGPISKPCTRKVQHFFVRRTPQGASAPVESFLKFACSENHSEYIPVILH